MDRITELEQKYVLDVLQSEFRSSQYKNYMSRFEAAFASKFGMDHAISFINGTSTMHAALEAFSIGPGDEVIVPPLTMSSTTFAVLHANATPVFADVNKYTFQICEQSIKSNITNKTRAIIPVSLYGMSPDLDSIHEIADAHNLIVIEDNAECFLGYYKNNLVGTTSNCSSFSFQSSKHLTSGEGGVILTNDFELATRIRCIQSLGYANLSAQAGKIKKSDIQDPAYSRHLSLGWNYRMPEVCCAIALAQTERIDELVTQRQYVANCFLSALDELNCKWLIPQHVPNHCRHSYWTLALVLDRDDITWHHFAAKICEFGGDKPYAAWKLSYNEPFLQTNNLLGRDRFISDLNLNKYKNPNCPNAEWLQPRLLQFKTSLWTTSNLNRNLTAFVNTIKYFTE